MQKLKFRHKISVICFFKFLDAWKRKNFNVELILFFKCVYNDYFELSQHKSNLNFKPLARIQLELACTQLPLWDDITCNGKKQA